MVPSKYEVGEQNVMTSYVNTLTYTLGVDIFTSVLGSVCEKSAARLGHVCFTESRY